MPSFIDQVAASPVTSARRSGRCRCRSAPSRRMAPARADSGHRASRRVAAALRRHGCAICRLAASGCRRSQASAPVRRGRRRRNAVHKVRLPPRVEPLRDRRESTVFSDPFPNRKPFYLRTFTLMLRKSQFAGWSPTTSWHRLISQCLPKKNRWGWYPVSELAHCPPRSMDRRPIGFGGRDGPSTCHRHEFSAAGLAMDPDTVTKRRGSPAHRGYGHVPRLRERHAQWRRHVAEQRSGLVVEKHAARGEHAGNIGGREHELGVAKYGRIFVAMMTSKEPPSRRSVTMSSGSARRTRATPGEMRTVFARRPVVARVWLSSITSPIPRPSRAKYSR